MRIKKILLISFIIIICLWSGGMYALAMDTGFTTDEMPSADQQLFLQNVSLSLIAEEPQPAAITCFDVNDAGLVAVGLESSAVCVYAPDGTFLYGYIFHCNGSFGVEWDGENILIYFVRSDVAAAFDAMGNPVEVRTICDTIDNNSYWNHEVNATKRIVDGAQYTIKNNMEPLNLFASAYSQLVRIDDDGTVIAIYDISSAYIARVITILLVAVVFAVLVISVLVLRLIKNH